jgi:hypothetical protein
VAITAKKNNGMVQEYVAALEKRGLQVRVVEQGGIQDFCFLKKAQKELVGGAVSTFVRWAAFLGDAKRVQFYILDGHGMRARAKINKPLSSIFGEFAWSNPQLQSRAHFRLITSETIEELDKQSTDAS